MRRMLFHFGFRIVVVAAVICILAAGLHGEVRAAVTAKTLSTNFTLVNLDPTNTATGTIDYLLESGEIWPGVASVYQSFSLEPNGGSLQIKQYFDPMMEIGKGSVVVRSNMPLGTVVQIQARSQVPTMGAYIGFTHGSNRFYLPLVMRNKTTQSGIVNGQIVIQNADASPVTVSVQLVPAPGVTGSYTKTIENILPGVSYYYDLSEESNLPAEWMGSAVVTAVDSGKIAVVNNLFAGNDGLLTYNGFDESNVGPHWIVPSFFSRLANGLSTTVTVQNLSGASIDIGAITLSCLSTAGNTPESFSLTNTASVENNASFSFNPVDNSPTPGFPDAWTGTCDVTANGDPNLVVIIQMRVVGSTIGNHGADAYQAIRAGGTDRVLLVPLMAKFLSNGFASVIGIRNLSTTPANVTLYYIPATNGNCPVSICDRDHDGVVEAGDDMIVVTNKTIGADQSMQRNLRLPVGLEAGGIPDAEDAVPNGWEGALRVESDQPIDGYVQLTFFMNYSGDQLMTYRVFTRPTP
jgi:hypothetical protein